MADLISTYQFASQFEEIKNKENIKERNLHLYLTSDERFSYCFSFCCSLFVFLVSAYFLRCA